jgi:hypothetical protein
LMIQQTVTQSLAVLGLPLLLLRFRVYRRATVAISTFITIQHRVLTLLSRQQAQTQLTEFHL